MDEQRQSVFDEGPLSVRLFRVDPVIASSCGQNTNQKKEKKPSFPSKAVLIAVPELGGNYPVLFLCHGFLLLNHHYSQLLRHVASHGFILVAPQVSYICMYIDAYVLMPL